MGAVGTCPSPWRGGPKVTLHCICLISSRPGGIALDPTHFNTSDRRALSEAWALHDACKQVGELVGSWKPDVLLLSTPHGVADLTQFAFFLNSKVSVVWSMGHGWVPLQGQLSWQWWVGYSAHISS